MTYRKTITETQIRRVAGKVFRIVNRVFRVGRGWYWVRSFAASRVGSAWRVAICLDRFELPDWAFFARTFLDPCEMYGETTIREIVQAVA